MRPDLDLKNHLKHISSILSKIHKGLFEHQLSVHEKSSGPVKTAGDKLNLLLGHPDFQWLRELSQFMAFTDEIIFQKEPITTDQVSAVHEEIEALFVTQVKPNFSPPYKACADVLPVVTRLHSELLEALNYRQ